MGIVPILLLLLNVFRLVLAKSPPPVECTASGCIVSNYLGAWSDRTSCKAAAVAYPRTEEELLRVVGQGVKHKQKMKVVSKWSHSIPKLVCPGGDHGLLISTQNLDTNMAVDSDTMTAVADAGVLLNDFLSFLSTAGYALPAATYWGAVSIAGALSTGAHGSSLWSKGTALHDHVVWIRLVVPATEGQGFAKVLHLSESSEKEVISLLDAAKVSLGVLGAISKVAFRVETMFKRSVTLELMDDNEIENRILTFAKSYEFGDVCWHPSLKKMMLKMDIRMPVDTPGEGVNRYKGFQPMPLSKVLKSREAEERMESERNSSSLCALSKMILSSRIPSGNGYLNDGLAFTGFPVVGFNHLMQTARGCEDVASASLVEDGVGEEPNGAAQWNQALGLHVDAQICSWDPRVNGSFFHQVAFSLPMDKARAFVLDIKQLRDMEASSLCGLSIYGGIYLRFVRTSTAYLGQQEDGIEFDFTFFRSRDGGKGTLNEDIMQEIEQMALFKYRAKPHWGKNRNVAFTSVQGGTVRDLDKFLLAKKQLDPEGYFSSEWSDGVLGGHTENILHTKDHCALEGMCVCSHDRHCAPEQGYFCRPGRLFAAARVCRYQAAPAVI